MAKAIQRLMAVRLRKNGESVKAIAKKLGISTGTVSIWTRDIELTSQQKETLENRRIAAGHRGRMMGVEKNKKKKQERIEIAQTEAQERIQIVSDDNLFFTGLALYWGEGVKANTSALAVVNSDPQVIRLMKRWFIECWGVETNRFQPRIFISDTHRDREDILLQYWSKQLNLPKEQFRRTVFLRDRRKIYENRDIYYGVLALRIAKGTDLKYKILAHIRQVAKVAMPA